MAMTSRVCFVVIGLVFAASRAFAAPGAATLRSPSGVVNATTIAFTWDAVADSTWYQFWLGAASPSALVQAQWYTAAQAGCSGGGTCTITVTPPVSSEGHFWYIQTYGPSGTGPWSAGLRFTVRDSGAWSTILPSAQRFTLVMGDAAVLDNETGLTWRRAPGVTAMPWASTVSACGSTIVGERLGWRVPQYPELESLMSLSDGAVLPAGHPFTGFEGRFWTLTVVPGGTDAFYVEFHSGGAGAFIGSQSPATNSRVWCVRGPAR